jgi:hypothetical protein
MRETKITIPELALLAGTRALAGAGIGLLLANRLSDDQRRAVGWTLFLVGALSTIPLAFEVFGGQRLSALGEEREQGVNEPWPKASERLGQPDAFART